MTAELIIAPRTTDQPVRNEIRPPAPIRTTSVLIAMVHLTRSWPKKERLGAHWPGIHLRESRTKVSRPASRADRPSALAAVAPWPPAALWIVLRVSAVAVPVGNARPSRLI